jgi:FKBP-type peptidyl-prolyl cis-trans isomerase
MRRTLVLSALVAAALAACRQDTERSERTGDDAPPAADRKEEPVGERPGTDRAAPPAQDGAPKADGAWQKTASGLEYQVLVPGKGGKPPKMGDTVKVNYKGWRDVGGQEKVFDESARHGGPAEFQVGGVIEGWNEALKMMTPPAKWRLRIPPQLGYGAQGQGPDIPPNSTLYFDVELLAVDANPELVRIDPANAKTTASGLRYEVVKAGEGAPPTAEDAMEMRIVFFSPTGKLLDRRTMTARLADLSLPFLKEAPLLMPPGALYRFEVPPTIGFGSQARGPDLPANSTTFWEIEMIRVVKPMAVPAFEPVDEAKMTRRPSGLLVQVLKEGAGESPKFGQEVKVHYAGWLPDGTLFDSSYGRGEPAAFRVGQVIQGWNEALVGMKPGAVWKLVIPPQLAYGEQGSGDKIKPGATLVFRVELISASN